MKRKLDGSKKAKSCATPGCARELHADHPQRTKRGACCQACVFKIANNLVALPARFKLMTDDDKEIWAREKLPGFEQRKSEALDTRIYNEWGAHKKRVSAAYDLIIKAGWYALFTRYKHDKLLTPDPPTQSPAPPTQPPAQPTQSPAPPAQSGHQSHHDASAGTPATGNPAPANDCLSDQSDQSTDFSPDFGGTAAPCSEANECSFHAPAVDVDRGPVARALRIDRVGAVCVLNSTERSVFVFAGHTTILSAAPRKSASECPIIFLTAARLDNRVVALCSHCHPRSSRDRHVQMLYDGTLRQWLTKVDTESDSTLQTKVVSRVHTFLSTNPCRHADGFYTQHGLGGTSRTPDDVKSQGGWRAVATNGRRRLMQSMLSADDDNEFQLDAVEFKCDARMFHIAPPCSEDPRSDWGMWTDVPHGSKLLKVCLTCDPWKRRSCIHVPPVNEVESESKEGKATGWALERMFNNSLELEITARSRHKIPFMEGNVWEAGMKRNTELRAAVGGPVVNLGLPGGKRVSALLITTAGPVDVTIPVCDGPCTCQRAKTSTDGDDTGVAPTGPTQRRCLLYDGFEDGVMNYDGHTLWSWSVCHRWWTSTLFESKTYLGHWRAECEFLVTTKVISVEQHKWMLSLRKTFQAACVNFILLMRIDFPNLLACCNGEAGIYLDGTKLFIRSAIERLEESFGRPLKTDPTAVKHEVVRNEQLVYLPSISGPKSEHGLTTKEKKKINTLFNKVRVFSRDFTGATRTAVTKKVTHISTGKGCKRKEVREMERMLRRGGSRKLPEVWRDRLNQMACLLSFEPVCRHERDKGNAADKDTLLVANKSVGDFLRHLGGRYCTRGLVWDQAENLRAAVRATSLTELDAALRAMPRKCVVLLNFIRLVTDDCTVLIPHEYHGLLNSVVTLADSTVDPSGREPANRAEKSPPVIASPWDDFDFDNADAAGGVVWSDSDDCIHADLHGKRESYLVERGVMPVVDEWCRCQPCWARRDACANYFKDGVHGPFNPVFSADYTVRLYTADDTSSAAMLCNKQPKYKGKSTPGYMLVFCREHERLIMAYLLKWSESVRSVHDLLMARFPNGTRWCVYDNSCNVFKLMSAREPNFIADTVFLINRSHCGSHKWCSEIFNPDNYPDMNGCNSEVQEQENAKLYKKRMHLYGMGQTMFLFHIRVYMLFIQLRLRQAKIRRASAGHRRRQTPFFASATPPAGSCPDAVADEGDNVDSCCGDGDDNDDSDCYSDGDSGSDSDDSDSGSGSDSDSDSNSGSDSDSDSVSHSHSGSGSGSDRDSDSGSTTRP